MVVRKMILCLESPYKLFNYLSFLFELISDYLFFVIKKGKDNAFPFFFIGIQYLFFIF